MQWFNKVLRLPIHPFLFATYPGLALYVSNSAFISYLEPLPFYLAAIALSLLGIVFFRLLLGNIQKAALYCSLFFVLFFSYTALYQHLPAPVQKNSLLLLALGCAFIAAGIALLRVRNAYAVAANTLLNISTGLVFTAQIAQLVVLRYKEPATPAVAAHAAPRSTVAPETLRNRPDIYYLILDGYGREDVLKRSYHFNNSQFIGFLKAKGFFVASNSTSNYCRTAVSIPSSLNYNYIQQLVDTAQGRRASYPQMSQLVANASIFSVLKGYGYQIKTFRSGYSVIDAPPEGNPEALQDAASDFNYLLASKTPLALVEQNPLLYNLLYGFRLKLYSNPFKKHRQRIFTILEELPEAASPNQPTFVFADILAGHPPFVFKADGTATEPKREYTLMDGNDFLASRGASRAEYVAGYSAQVRYINKRLEIAISQILRHRKRPVVIILQGDHGPGADFDEEDIQKTLLQDRFPILNAIYFSDQDTAKLQENSTPVNTFRIVLNKYFDQNLPLLPNRNYYSPGSAITDFTAVTDKLREEK